MRKLFRQAGMPRRAPPSLSDCAVEESGDAPVITSPIRNVSYALRTASAREAIALDASVGGDVARVFWFDGTTLIGVRDVTDGALAWRPSASGVHLIRIVDDRGRSAERDVEVQIAHERIGSGASEHHGAW
jgi:penicillin-binding protein 1C